MQELQAAKDTAYQKLLDAEDDHLSATSRYDRQETRRKLQRARERFDEARAKLREHRTAPRTNNAPGQERDPDQGQKVGDGSHPNQQPEDRTES